MVVLVSDGNSQDLWDDVIHTSNRLRTTGADVYAVTVSKQYMFKSVFWLLKNKREVLGSWNFMRETNGECISTPG